MRRNFFKICINYNPTIFFFQYTKILILCLGCGSYQKFSQGAYYFVFFLPLRQALGAPAHFRSWLKTNFSSKFCKIIDQSNLEMSNCHVVKVKTTKIKTIKIVLYSKSKPSKSYKFPLFFKFLSKFSSRSLRLVLRRHSLRPCRQILSEF